MSVRSSRAAAALLTAAALAACTTTASSAPVDAGPPAGPAPATAPATAPVEDPGDVVGRVVGPDGEPLAGALVDVLRRPDVPEPGVVANRTRRRTWTDAQGRFRVRQAADAYLVHACIPETDDRRVCGPIGQAVDALPVYAGPAGQSDSWVTQTSLFTATTTDRRVGVLRASAPATVVGELTGEPFTEVRVMRLNDTMALRTATDARGRYRFDGLAGGPYYVEAGGAGALPWRSAAFDLPTGGRHRVRAATLDGGATLTGRAATPSGTPAVGLELLVRKDGEPVAATSTDGSGEFTIPGLGAGAYAVAVAGAGGTWAPASRTVEVSTASGEHDASLTVRRGARIVVPLRTPLDPAGSRAGDELRDEDGRPVLANVNRGGRAVYSGLAAGRYTVVAGTADHYATRTFAVAPGERRELAPLSLTTPTLVLRGRTAPHAVVEATTGELCPPGGAPRHGGFHEIEQADARGRYRLTGLVPGSLMLGADGWPRSHAPRCWPGVEVTASMRRDLPLDAGGTASGRLVYAATGTPVITDLSYELTYPAPTTTSPTDEHPARSKVGPTGHFAIKRLGPATVSGGLALEAESAQLNSQEFLVVFPYQDATPYWLESETTELTVGPGIDLALGDVPLVVHPLPSEVR